ncbi:MAG: ATP-dependent DNA ligase [Herbiconiux sp.]|nr:ATP-dependent DNA ligase [Herbiconiux sp.]
MEDRLLAHLRIVILSKMRNQESFSLSWTMDANQGSGRETLWVHPSIPLRFRFYGSRPPAINRAWIELMVSAASRGDLRIMAEPSAHEVEG